MQVNAYPGGSKPPPYDYIVGSPKRQKSFWGEETLRNARGVDFVRNPPQAIWSQCRRGRGGYYPPANPSVSCADSSLYTREPWFAVSRKLKQCIINALIVDSVFRPQLSYRKASLLRDGRSLRHFEIKSNFAAHAHSISRLPRQFPRGGSHTVGEHFGASETNKNISIFLRKRQ